MSGLLPVAAGLCALVAGGLLAPALRRRRADAAQPSETAIYRDQLAELEQDLARGTIAPREAAAARVEIERRLLRAAARGESTLSASPRLRALAIGAAVLAPVAAVALYLPLGAPSLPDLPFAARGGGDDGALMIRQMVTRLEERLAREPDDVEGWLMLGRSRAVLGDMPSAVEAWRRARELAPDDTRAAAGLAEALTLLAGGTVPPEAVRLFREVAADVPDDPQAGFYLGLAAVQAGDSEAGKARWRQALAVLPAGEPARRQLEDAIGRAGEQLGIEVGELMATPPAAPAGAGALAGMTPAEQRELIRGMVGKLEARLRARPGDAEGWLRLGQARQILEQPEEAREAFEKAVALAPEDPDALKGYAASLLGPADAETGLPEVGEQALALFRKASELRPGDPEPWWFLGVAASQRGELARARDDWRHLLELIGPEHPDFAGIRARIEALGG